MAKVSISLCMIVRDEEERLGRCIDAARPYVDEIVVVDTGSSDRTLDIARAAGARVIEQPWQDDFARARNTSMDAARGEWILVLDADEVITPEAGEELRRAVRRRDLLGLFIPLRDHGDEGRETVTLLFRAVRNRKDVRFRFRLHEQLLPDANRVVRAEKLRLGQLRGEIHHDGYQREIVAKKGKSERNRRIYEAQLRDTPDNLYMLYKYADFLRRFPEEADRVTGLLERAYVLLQGCSAQERHDLSFSGEACALLGMAKERLGQREEAMRVLEFGVTQCRESPSLWYVYAHALLRGGRAPEAEAAFRKCAAAHGKPALVPAQPHVTGTGATLGIARALAHQGRTREGADLAWSAVGCAPAKEETIAAWMEIETVARDWSRTIQRVIERVRSVPDCAATWFRGGELLFRLRLFYKAIPWFARAAELGKTPGPAFAMQGECFLAAGHHELALDTFLRGLPDVRCRAALLLMSIAYDVDPAERNDLGDPELRAECRRLVGNLRDIGDQRLAGRLHDASRELSVIDPEASEFLEAALA